MMLNAELVITAMKEMNMEIRSTVEDLVRCSGREALMFVLYLYQVCGTGDPSPPPRMLCSARVGGASDLGSVVDCVSRPRPTLQTLPQYVPKASIHFTGGLHQALSKSIELTCVLLLLFCVPDFCGSLLA